ncbi:MAG: histidine kinase [Ignavibacteriales bacterium]|nr:histidine kinase [Ignavibacteriales bacterium]
MKIKFLHIVIGWALFAVVITVLMALVHPPGNNAFNIISEFKWESAFALVWIPATPFVLGISKRFSVSGNKKIRNGIILSVVGMTLSVVQCFAHSLIAFGLNMGAGEYTTAVMLYSFYYNIDKMLIVYCVLVVFQQALTYYEEMQQKEVKASQLQAQLSEAQMQALKMQLQPHFLFNTLNAIVTLIHKNPDLAEEMIVRLSNFLRLTLEVSGKQCVTLKEELDFVNAYIDIEQVRFDGKLTYRQSVSNEMLDAQVPILVLQPLVENAIKHGISRYEDAHSIEISAQRSNGTLQLSVIDDGMPSGTTAKFFGNTGIGLQNTKARLETMYGKDAAMTLSANLPRGLRVDLTIPYQEFTGEN